jgi:hypothetical protein
MDPLHIVAAARLKPSAAEFWGLEGLLTEYRDIFAIYSDNYERVDRVYHCINMGDAQLIRHTSKRLP